MGTEQPGTPAPQPQPTPPAGIGAAPMGPGGAPLSEWWKRLVAAIIDSVVIGIPFSIIYIIFVASWIAGTAGELTIDPNTGQTTFTGASAGLGFIGAFFVIWLIFFVLSGAYYVYFWGSEKGQTLGKMAMKIRVVDETSGGPIGYGKAALRALVMFALGLACGVGTILDGLWPLWDPKRQALHDKVAKTQVIDVPA